MDVMRRLLPDGIAGRFALLLLAALAAATVVALTMLSAERTRMDRAAQAEQEIERILALVPAMEALPEAARAGVAKRASTRSARVSIDSQPAVREPQGNARSRALAARLTEALGSREVRAEVLGRRMDRRFGRGDRLSLSIALDGADKGRPVWLNIQSSPARIAPTGVAVDAVFLSFGLALVAVLGAAVLFLRRLTRPIVALAEAATAAGKGDRSARVAETGPRELRAAAAAFNDMQVRVSRFEAERMRTLGAVGHDLRTPLTSLRIRAELLEDPDLRDGMIRTLDEMTVMADGLVDFARGTQEAELPQILDLAGFLGGLCKDRGAGFRSGPALSVRARPVALTRAIGNLVDNALRYAGAAEVALERAGDQAVILVQDRGPGIPAERLETVFAPFVRGEDSRSSDTGGAGLGLSIAQSLIQTMGGTVRLENRDGGGLTARVSLPLAAK